jgi:hypothetical protein
MVGYGNFWRNRCSKAEFRFIFPNGSGTETNNGVVIGRERNTLAACWGVSKEAAAPGAVCQEPIQFIAGYRCARPGFAALRSRNHEKNL